MAHKGGYDKGCLGDLGDDSEHSRSTDGQLVRGFNCGGLHQLQNSFVLMKTSAPHRANCS